MRTEFRTDWHNDYILPLSILNRFLTYCPFEHQKKKNIRRFALPIEKLLVFTLDIPQ